MCEIFNCLPETPSFMPIWLVSLMILGNLKPKAVLLDIFSIKKWKSTKDLFKDMQLRGREVKNTSQNPLPLVQVACGQPLCPHLLPWCELSISIVKLLLKVAWVMTLRTTTRASQYSRVSYNRESFPSAFSKTTTCAEYFLQCLFAKIQFLEFYPWENFMAQTNYWDETSLTKEPPARLMTLTTSCWSTQAHWRLVILMQRECISTQLSVRKYAGESWKARVDLRQAVIFDWQFPLKNCTLKLKQT